MSRSVLHRSLSVSTPAFVYDVVAIRSQCKRWRELCKAFAVRQLFPLKCHSLVGPLRIISEYVDGFAASSPFEAQLAREILGDGKTVHLTSPALRDSDPAMLTAFCDGISLNSISQWRQFKDKLYGRITCGLRINPQLSFLSDNRFDPCRMHSRLGAPLEQVKDAFAIQPELFHGIEGIHFHSNCDATDWAPLRNVVQHLDKHISDLLNQCRWINLGGGYLLSGNDNRPAPLFEVIELLEKKYQLEVILEPGAGVVRDTCFLVAQVVDLFKSDGKHVAVLDTTVNHMPEVFEYQFSPDVVGDTDDGRYSYILTGSTCLAGDVFGEYAFDEPIEIGSKVTFSGVGAYTLVKSHMFNGINLPSIYSLGEDGRLTLQRQYDYEDFRQRWEPRRHDDEGLRNIAKNSHRSGRRKSA